MKLKSAVAIVRYVKDLSQTIPFYAKLGFRFKTKEPTRATAYLNWWWFGSLAYFSVENISKAFEEATASGVRPSSEPITLRGNKKFMIIGPGRQQTGLLYPEVSG